MSQFVTIPPLLQYVQIYVRMFNKVGWNRSQKYYLQYLQSCRRPA
jgi:hypothetical protein